MRPVQPYVFLEINSAGQFLFKEIADPGLPMLDTFCRYLIRADSMPSEDFPTLRFADFLAEEGERLVGKSKLSNSLY